LIKLNNNIDVPMGHITSVRKTKAGRVCKTRKCKTVLSSYNLDKYCAVCKKKRFDKEYG